ncbi:MAG: hypothetical protein AB9866_02385 [Syntrophobacteraceae bacterium]
MMPLNLSKPATWNLEQKTEGGCELNIEFLLDDGAKHHAGYCFLSETECVNWIIHELVMRAKREGRVTNDKNLDEEVALYERMLNSVVEAFKEKGVALFQQGAISCKSTAAQPLRHG